MQLSIKGLALALGLAWGGGVALLGLAASLGWGRALVEVLGSVYVGFGPSPLGSAIDGALGGIVIAWLYNRSLIDALRPPWPPGSSPQGSRICS